MTTGNTQSVRATDPAPVKITREISLQWILGLLGALAVQVIVFWSGQRTQAEAINAQAEAIKAMSAEVKGLGGDIQEGRLKSLELALRLAEVERRVASLEANSGPGKGLPGHP